MFNGKGFMYPMLLPPMPTTNTNTKIFKYKIGDRFIDTRFNDVIEVTGYNKRLNTYKGKIILNFGKKTRTMESDVIYESRLDSLVRLEKNFKKKDDIVSYRIFYFDNLGKRSKTYDVQLSNIKSLARLLNSWVKINPKRRIIMVAVLDENGCYVCNVKFLAKEIKEQKFLAGMKERLLAHAKYECGYEVVTNF